mmetsp:Transcript_16242/g.35218  ORF Transcript_16242/g.35218 Transcript_16242/m.35218 type:complete len:666 (+) Transcript_16242:201-2198(+)
MREEEEESHDPMDFPLVRVLRALLVSIGCSCLLGSPSSANELAQQLQPLSVDIPLVRANLSMEQARQSLLYREWYSLSAFSHQQAINQRSSNSNQNNTEPVVTDTSIPDGIENAALHGSLTELGEYYVTLHIAGQPVNVQVDTGSSALAVPLSECVDCRRGDRRVHLDVPDAVARCDDVAKCRSDTCSMIGSNPRCGACARRTRSCCAVRMPNACGFALEYADGSGARGALVHADIELGSLKAQHVYFGGILTDSPRFERDHVDGILGMAYPRLACNPSCTRPFFDELVAQSQLSRSVFGICTARRGGMLTLGGANKSLYSGNMQCSPLSRTDRGFYDVSITHLHVAHPPRAALQRGDSDKHGERAVQVKLDLPQFDAAIIDSGTTLMVVTPAAFEALREYFFKHFSHVPGLSDPQQSWFSRHYCVRLTDRQLDALPSLVLELPAVPDANGSSRSDRVRLELEPRDYLLQVKRPGFRCLGIHALAGLESLGNNVIIGGTILRKYYTLYDRERHMVCFAASTTDCVARSNNAPQQPVVLPKSVENAGGSDVFGGVPLSSSSKRKRAPVIAFALVALVAATGLVLAAVVVRAVRRGSSYNVLEQNGLYSDGSHAHVLWEYGSSASEQPAEHAVENVHAESSCEGRPSSFVRSDLVKDFEQNRAPDDP